MCHNVCFTKQADPETCPVWKHNKSRITHTHQLDLAMSASNVAQRFRMYSVHSCLSAATLETIPQLRMTSLQAIPEVR